MRQGKSPLTKGRLPEASREVERVRFPRADLQSAPGRLRASCSPASRPVRGVLPQDWDRNARVTPVRTKSQEAWPGVEPRTAMSLRKSRGGTPTGVRAPSSARRAQARRLVTCVCRRSASPLCRGKKKASGEWWIAKRASPIRASPLIKLRRGSRCENAGSFRPRYRGGG